MPEPKLVETSDPITDIAEFRKRIEMRGTASRREILWLVDEMARIASDRNELSEEMEKCHHLLDVATSEYEEETTSIETLESRLKDYLFPEGRITDDMVNGDD